MPPPPEQPPPPAQPLPPEATQTFTLAVRMDETVESFTVARQAVYRHNLAGYLGVDVSRITLRISTGSILVEADVAAPAVSAPAVARLLNSLVEDAQASSNWVADTLGAGDPNGFSLIAASFSTTAAPDLPPPPASPLVVGPEDEQNLAGSSDGGPGTGGLVAIILGSTLALALIACAASKALRGRLSSRFAQRDHLYKAADSSTISATQSSGGEP